MTATIEAPDLTRLTDEQLCTAGADTGMFAAVQAEFDRRDRADRRNRAEAQLRHEWYDAMNAQREAFEAEGIGYVLNREGKRRGISEWALWTGAWSMVEQYGTDEIKAFFAHSRRMTFAEYKRQRNAAGRIQREEWRDRHEISNGGNDHEQDIHGDHGFGRPAELAGDEPGSLRHEPAPQETQEAGPGCDVHGSGPAPDDSDEGEVPETGSGDGGSGGPVQPGLGGSDDSSDGDEPAPDPQAAPVDGAALLDEAVTYIRRFCVLPSDAYYDVCAVWDAGTHAYQAFPNYPRLGFVSDEPASGKSRAISINSLLCAKTKKLTNYTAAVLVRWLGKGRTVALDETDTIFRTDRSAPLMQAALNDGFNFKGVADKCSGADDVAEKSIYCPVLFGGLRMLPDAVMSRTLLVYMEKRRPEQKIDSYMARLHDSQGEAIGQALGDWAGSVALELAEAWPDLPEGCEDRTADCWWPLFAIADVAGGDWPERIRAAYAELAKGVTAEPEISPLQRLLGDVHAVWDEGDKIGSADLLKRLNGIPGAPWVTWWPEAAAPRELAAMLRPAGIEVKKIRVPGRAPVQGYERRDFDRAWAERVPVVPDVPANGETEAE